MQSSGSKITLTFHLHLISKNTHKQAVVVAFSFIGGGLVKLSLCDSSKNGGELVFLVEGELVVGGAVQVDGESRNAQERSETWRG